MVEISQVLVLGDRRERTGEAGNPVLTMQSFFHSFLLYSVNIIHSLLSKHCSLIHLFSYPAKTPNNHSSYKYYSFTQQTPLIHSFIHSTLSIQ